jgi:DNA-binding transcriptional LysR family regulator
MQSDTPRGHSDASWDDYRLLLATVQARSFQGAGQALRLSTSTVSRRIAALERRMGAPLFERLPHGVVPTAHGQLLADVAHKLASELTRAERQLGSLDSDAVGRVRLTAGEGFGEALVPLVAEFRQLHPEIDVELSIDARLYDLAAGEADLALRMPRPTERGILARKLGSLRFGLFASHVYLARRGTPHTLAELERHEFIGFAGSLAHMLPARFLAELALERTAVRVNSTPLVRQAVLAHLGIGVLATVTTDLVRVLPELRSEALALWLARHPRTRGVTRVERLARFLGERIGRSLSD